MAIHKNAEDGLISFRLIGAEVDDGCVRVSDLSNCMAKIQGCLKHVERCITGTSPSLQYVIKKMHVGSPADCELFAKTPKRKNDIRKSVSTLLLTTIASLAAGDNGSLDARLDYEALKSFQEFPKVARPAEERSSRRLIVGGHEINPTYFVTIDEALSIEESSYGSISGSLERIDVHKSPQFSLFPRPIGSPSVRCYFGDEMLGQITDALKTKSHVTVYGKKDYIQGRLHPLRVKVDSVEIHQNDQIPSFASFTGCLKDIEGDSVDLIRKIRNEWPD